MSKQTGGSASPNKASGCGGSSLDTNGMTLRDYFAIRALCAMTSAPIGKFNHSNSNEAVVDAYVIADAMIAERNK